MTQQEPMTITCTNVKRTTTVQLIHPIPSVGKAATIEWDESGMRIREDDTTKTFFIPWSNVACFIQEPTKCTNSTQE